MKKYLIIRWSSLFFIILSVSLLFVSYVLSYWSWKNPVRLPYPLNTTSNEAYPCLNSSGDTIYFSSDRIHKNSDNVDVTDWDLYSATKNGLGWNTPENLTSINTEYSESSPFLSQDGNYLYFASYREAKGEGKWDLYYSSRSGSTWNSPINMGSTINSSADEISPCLSPDGLTLYFASNRVGGKGRLDLWFSNRQNISSPWQTPINLTRVNSGENDFAPCMIHEASEKCDYLYFTSDRTGGAWDIFYARYDKLLGWFAGYQISYPVSSYEAEAYPFVTSDHFNMYFSSQRRNDFATLDVTKNGAMDIWTVVKGKSMPAIDMYSLSLMLVFFSSIFIYFSWKARISRISYFEREGMQS